MKKSALYRRMQYWVLRDETLNEDQKLFAIETLMDEQRLFAYLEHELEKEEQG